MKTTELQGCDIAWIVRRLPEVVVMLFKMAAKNVDFVCVKGGQPLFVKIPRLMLGGGFIRDCISGENPRDVDLFVSSEDEAKAAAAHLADELTKKGRQVKTIETDNAITIIGAEVAIQVISRWTFDDPVKMVESFDFTIASAAVWWERGTSGSSGQWKGVAHERFYADLAAKRLIYLAPVREEEPGGSMLRVLKFYGRGYRIPLDSLGSVIARLVKSIEFDKCHPINEGDTPFEERVGMVVSGLLREVDPNVADREMMPAGE